jgi:hypothetical protein
MATQLRVYPAAKELPRNRLPAPTVGIRFGDLLPLMVLAQRHNYLWLQDFLDDEVRISPDLYEVIRAFRNFRPSA